ncbi:hypothetical protein TWF730_003416 [Orbilia blumenaviensis]|uniref:Helicase-associated domain-containing protein n=1 Tax=Orbilia blumenaviensis TaxID=1796055 RepID=A0AAV9U8B8_9PEZI
MDKLVQKAVDDHRVTIWVNTACSSMESLPNYLLDAGWGDSGKLICCIHPTDLDAKQAVKVHFDTGSTNPIVAYSIPFEDLSSSQTKIIHTSARLMIQEALVDPLLNRYSIILVNDYHLRSLEIDLILGLLKKILKRREDFHILVAGVTPEALVPLSLYLPDAAVLSLNSSTYPVDLHNISASTDNYISSALEIVLTLPTNVQAAGNTVVFLPTIEGFELQKRLQDSSWASANAHAIHTINSVAELDSFEKHAEDAESTAYVIITSLPAELVARHTPVTIVVDSGFQEVRYNRHGFANLVSTQPISQETANQRTRIAGLSTPGKCYRLYPQNQFDSLQKTETPEIQRFSLDDSVLRLKSLGVDNILRFDYLSPPSASSIAEALNRLSEIGAMNENAELTKPFGEQLAQLPLKPLHGALLLKSLEKGCFEQILSLIAVCLSKGDYFDHEKSQPFIAQEGDSLTWLNIYEGFTKSGTAPARGIWCRKHGLSEQRLLKAVDIRTQLLRILQYRRIKITKSELATSTTITRCIAGIYKRNFALRTPNGLFRTTEGSLEVRIHPSSVLYSLNPGFIVFEEVVQNGGKLFVKDVTAVERDWIEGV